MLKLAARRRALEEAVADPNTPLAVEVGKQNSKLYYLTGECGASDVRSIIRSG